MTANNIYGLVLAAGTSARFGLHDKLSAEIDGMSVLRRTVSAYVEALNETWVVIRSMERLERYGLEDLPVHFVRNDEYRLGQSASLRLGVSALPADASAAIIGVGDQPLLSPSSITMLIHSWRSSAAPIVAPLYRGQRGNPVLFDRKIFPELLKVEGDVGGRGVIRNHEVQTVDIPEWWTGMDIDTPNDLDELLAHVRS